MKPVVKLLINRHNNKYSYTGASDDNLLKNIELFDKLSLRFSNRVLFIKDVIGSNEICCWSFYGHGKRIAEVCLKRGHNDNTQYIRNSTLASFDCSEWNMHLKLTFLA